METLPDEKERAARLRALEIAELSALRTDIRALFNLMELLLGTLDPQAAAFYAQAQALEEQIGQAQKE